MTLALVLAAGLAACGTAPGGEDEDSGGGGEEPAPTEPVQLDAPPESPALEGTFDADVDIEYDEDDFSDDPGLREGDAVQVLRREVEIGFDPDATVAEIEDLLIEVDGGIVSMVGGLPILVVTIPDPGSIDALEDVLSRLRDDDRVLYALKSVVVEEPRPVPEEEEAEPEPTLAPQDIPGHVSGMGRIDHHLAARAHAAWNAADALPAQADRPGLVVGDSFGNGTPSNGYDADFTDGDFGSGNASRHGHHVLGIITGAYVEDTSLSPGRDDVTGLFPETLEVRAVDLRNGVNTWPRRQNLLIRRIQDVVSGGSDARAVVNTSLNSRDLANQQTQALAWITRVRGAGSSGLADLLSRLETEGSGLEERFFHATSSGNANRNPDGTFTRWAAEDNSLFAFAALNDFSFSIPFVRTITVPALTNTAVVENRMNTNHAAADPAGGANLRPLPGCASNTSIMGGTLSAMGTGVWSFTASGATGLSGTSMATPQVAALGAWVWALDPSLSASEVARLLENTALDDPTTSRAPAGGTCHSTAPQPVIDAYAATIAAGGEDVMRELLDVDEDGDFDEDDLSAFDVERTTGSANLAYDEFDLNGNGRAFAFAQGERFDLNRDGSFGTASRTYVNEAGFNVSVAYDEGDVRDLDVLCFFAYSSLYQGDTDARDARLANACSGTAELEIISPDPGETFRETDPSLTFEAAVDAPPGESNDAFDITWSYEGEGSPVVLSETTLSGEPLVVNDLPCENLLVRAEIDVPNLGTVSDVVTVSCLPKEETFFLNVAADQGGSVREDGQVLVGGDDGEIRVGDDLQDRAIQGNLEVTLATLPDDLAAITSATLIFTIQEDVNLPSTSMSELGVYQVDYGDALEADDFASEDGVTFLPGLATTTDFSFGAKNLDVTTAVQDAWDDRDTRGERVQFLMRFHPNMSNDNGEPNHLRILYETDGQGTTRLPALEITFENY